MIISKGNGSHYILMDTKTGEVINDVVAFTPFTERTDFKDLCEVQSVNTVELDDMLSSCHRYWKDVDEMKGEGDDE